ncbi:hypothetical protein [Geodermatophilus sp. SYSU D00815]
MTSPRPTSAAETDDPKAEEADQPKGTGINVVQVAAGALAAVSSAVLLSFFGVAGTLIGAALASVVSSVGAALYSSSLAKTNERLRKALAGGRTHRPAAVAADPDATAVLPARLDPRRAPARRFQPRWGRVAAYAVGVFAVAMGIITGIELIGQKPVSAMVTSSSSAGTTTLGELGDDQADAGTTTPSTPTSPGTSTPATPTAEESPSRPTGSVEDDSEPTGPTGSASSSAPTGTGAPSSAAGPTGSASGAPQTTQPAPLGGATPPAGAASPDDTEPLDGAAPLDGAEPAP